MPGSGPDRTGKSRWILTADEGCCRLLRLDEDASGRARATPLDQIQNTWDGHEYRRPSPRGAKDGHTYASIGHGDETRRARFAKEIAVWLERTADEHHIGRVTVFATPRFLGALRLAWSSRFVLRVDERHGDLTNMRPADLAQHASIASLLSDRS